VDDVGGLNVLQTLALAVSAFRAPHSFHPVAAPTSLSIAFPQDVLASATEP
jgi:hypothetical protein